MSKQRIKLFFLFILTFILLGAFLRHKVCQFLITYATTKSTGLNLTLDDLHLDILNNTLYIRGLTLFNPPGFKNESLAKAKEIYIQYAPIDSLLNRRLHLEQITVEISEINIIRNEKGHLNVSAFRKAQLRPGQEVLSALTAVRAEAPAVPPGAVVQKATKAKVSSRQKSKLLIERLKLSLKKVVFVDYQAEIGQPAVIVFTTQQPLLFKNVSNLNNLINSVSQNYLTKQ